MRKSYKNILFIAIALAYSTGIEANPKTTNDFKNGSNVLPTLEIDLATTYSDSDVIPRVQVKKSEKVCNAFAKKLIRGQGPSGVGPFISATCGNKKQTPWRLVAARKDESSTVTFVLTYLDSSSSDESNRTIEIARLELETELGADRLLADKKLSDLLALYFSESMPFRSIVSVEELKKSLTVKTQMQAGLGACMKSSESLTLYDLEFADAAWRPTIIATSIATRITIRAKNVPSDEHKSATYSFAAASLENQSAQILFLHDAQHKRSNTESLKRCLVRDVKKLNQKWYSLLSSAYVGVRYGRPFIKGETAYNQASLIGVFGEFRSGALDGLKVHYDFAPSASKDHGSSVSEYRFSRVLFGLSFSKAIDVGLFNFMDVTPRLGITNLRLEHIPSAESEEIGYEFIQHRAPTLGLEFGAERRHSIGLYRLWGYLSYSTGILTIDKAYSTRAARAGVDSFFNIIDLGPLHMGLMCFAVYDYTAIKATNVELNATQLQSVALSNGFVGGGMTVNW